MLSGNAASNTDIAWPSLVAPPLSSPRVANTWSALRVAICSVVALDSRLAAATVRAAWRTGNPRSRLVRPNTPVGSTGCSSRGPVVDLLAVVAEFTSGLDFRGLALGGAAF
jgi:hypothetical protein